MSPDKHGWYTPASDLEDKFYIPSPDYAEDIDDISLAVRHRRYCQGCEAYYPVSKPHEHGSEVCQLDADGTCGWIHPR